MTVIAWAVGSKRETAAIMDQAVQQPLSAFDIAPWQAMLDRHPQIFLGMQPGSRIGLLPQEDFDSPSATMLVWQATEHGMRAQYEPFPGFAEVKIDLLFMPDYETVGALHDTSNVAPFTRLKTGVRRRQIMLYVVKPRAELLEQGYEDFLDSLGLVFMGACR